MEEEGSGRVVYVAYEGGRQWGLVDGRRGDSVGGRARMAMGGVEGGFGSETGSVDTKGGDDETAVIPRQARACLRNLDRVSSSGMMSFVIGT